MAKINFDYKQFLLQKGERVGLYVSAGLAVLLLVLGVILLTTGEGSLSARANSKILEDTTNQKNLAMTGPNRSAPSADQVTIMKTIDPKLSGKNMNVRLASPDFAFVGPLFPPFDSSGDHRREPRVFQPTEFLAKAFGVQLNMYMFDPDREKIAVLTNSPPVKDDGKKKNRRSPSSNYLGGMMGRGGRGGTGSPSGPGGASGQNGYRDMMGAMPPMMQPGGKGSPTMGPGRGMGPMMKPNFGSDEKKIITWVPFDEVQKTGSATLAENMVPTTVAMIVSSFPLKRQIEEFQRALHARTSGEMFGKSSEFRFTGIRVQRRTISRDGVEVDFLDLPVEKVVQWWAVNNGHRPEQEDPDLVPVLNWSDHLAMPRPIQFPGSPDYPPLEKELPSIKATLEELKKADKPVSVVNSPFKDPDQVDAYSLGALADTDTKPANEQPPKKDKVDEDNPYAGQQLHMPEFALIRFLDVYVEAGKTYEYRIQVRMHNPNYKRHDVRSDLAEKPELESEWTLMPQKLTIPEELNYYAVDMMTVDPKWARSHQEDAHPLNKDQAALQIHKWLPSVSPRKDASAIFPVGNWSVAEREVVYRGERIGQSHTVEVPIWMVDQMQFVLATNPAERLTKNKHKIHVPFGAANNDAVLVDFTDVKASYRKTGAAGDDGLPTTNEVKDPNLPQELLILTAEGKLLVHSAAADSNDPERKQRITAWHKLIDELEKKNDPKSGKPEDNIFTKPGGQ